MDEAGKQKQRAVYLAALLAVLVVIVYALTFVKLPVWLPALK